MEGPCQELSRGEYREARISTFILKKLMNTLAMHRHWIDKECPTVLEIPGKISILEEFVALCKSSIQTNLSICICVCLCVCVCVRVRVYACVHV